MTDHTYKSWSISVVEFLDKLASNKNKKYTI